MEIQADLGGITEAVLEIAISYSSAHDSGIIIHISTGQFIVI